MTTTPATGRTARFEGLVLVLILLVVAGFSGAASFTHVKDWTLANSPPGTGEWFGWANAVISELVPIAALLTIRQRRRNGAPIGYPIFLLVAAASLSLAAQVAVAKPSLSGWLLSAVPALAFMGLVKLVLAPGKTANTTDEQPAATTDTMPAAVAEPSAPVNPPIPTSVDIPAPVPVVDAPASVPAVDIPPAPVVEPEPVVVPAHLLPTARFAVVQHEQATGRPITADELADRLSIGTAVATQLLHQINPPAVPVRVNGTPVLGGAR